MSDFFDNEDIPLTPVQKAIAVVTTLIFACFLGLLVVQAVEAERNTQILKEINRIHENRHGNPKMTIPSKKLEFSPFGEAIVIPELKPYEDIPTLKEIIDGIENAENSGNP